MKPERWNRTKAIFDRALDAAPGEREALVHALCADESDLEAEVLQLLNAHDSSGDFLEEAAANLHEYLAPKYNQPVLQVGMVLARRFEIRRFIAAGGMGEVYEAWDSHLNEAVALKTVLADISANESIIQRFKHEVRHAREVSHANICRVHELFCDESATGHSIWFLTMELLNGMTLAERIRKDGGMPPQIASSIAEQVLSGLEAAHGRGLVHRDFKSSNVMLVEDPNAPLRAVITDFGLAIRRDSSGSQPSEMAGTGTPGYMAPEQRRGGDVGPLADQYSFGVVLWEMTTGRMPEQYGEDARVLRKKGYPDVWSTVIRRCMQVDPAARYSDMSAVRAALIPSRWRKGTTWIAASAAVLVIALMGVVSNRMTVPAAKCIICDTTQITSDTDKAESPSLSKDGHLVAYSSDQAETGNLDIFTQELPSGNARRLTHDSGRDTTPNVSPDGKFVAYRSERDGGGIYLAEVGSNKEPRLLAPNGRNPKISPDGTSLLYWTGDLDSSIESGKVFRIRLTGGQPEQIAPQMADARYPVWNTDGKHILITGCSEAGQLLPDCLDWWVDSLDDASLLQTHAYATLRSDNFLPGRLSSLEWRNDEIVFSAMGASKRLNLAEATFHPDRRFLEGAPHWLLQEGGGDLDPSIAGDSQIAFTRTTGALHIWRLRNIDGHKPEVLEKVTSDTEVDGSPFIADGGRYLVFARGRSLKRSVMLIDTATGQQTAIVNAGTPVQSPIIDRSGKWIAYQQTEADGASAIYAGQLGGPVKRICQNCTEPSGWFDGHHYFFFRTGAHEVSVADPERGTQKVVFRDADCVINDMSWSPDNGFMALVLSNKTSRHVGMVHLNPVTAEADSRPQSFPEIEGIPVHPRWFDHGKGLIYVSNKDGFQCVYERRFDAASRSFREPVAVSHFHAQRASIDDILPRVFNLSADGDVAYLNLGEQNSVIEIGHVNPKH